MLLVEDRLARGEFLGRLFSLFDNFGNQGDRGFTMILNGKYGSGKSTLLDFIDERNNTDNKFNVVRYNAWNDNLFENPLIPILREMSKLQGKGEKIKKGAVNVLKKIPKMFFGTLANVHGVDVSELLSNENIFSEYDEYKASLNEFRNILKDYCAQKKVLFLVDELDRCLPEYQIKVLETLYHLFEIPNLIVVIALDRNQLECSIKNKFGDDQNTLGYLSKFINLQVDLPNDRDSDFLYSLLDFHCEYCEEVKQTITNMILALNYSIREAQKVINEINLVCNESQNNGKQKRFYYWFPLLIAFVLLCKQESGVVYKKYFSYSQKDNYRTDKLSINESGFYKFLRDIKGTKLEIIIEYLKNEHFGKSCLFHVINSFSPIKNISEDDLAGYLGLALYEVQDILKEVHFAFPEQINGVIQKVKAIGF